ncbi:MAG: alpha-isopropylmalate synthase regulatory domain-containing protein, partial [Stellaceae bacterium]
RITPVAAVYAGDTGRAAMEAAKVAADKAAASQVAYGGTTDGKTIFGHLCTTCHSTGAVTRVMIETTDKDGTVWSTVGVSTNVIDASYNALHDSLTYKLWRTGRRD